MARVSGKGGTRDRLKHHVPGCVIFGRKRRVVADARARSSSTSASVLRPHGHALMQLSLSCGANIRLSCPSNLICDVGVEFRGASVGVERRRGVSGSKAARDPGRRDAPAGRSPRGANAVGRMGTSVNTNERT
eukprot:20873-Pelagococcus_subviridis.AAC.3